MDNLAHTLVGAALGRAVGDGRLPYPVLVGAIAANAPDGAEILVAPGCWRLHVDARCLDAHRGITHSFLGALVEIVVLAAIVGLVARVASDRPGRPAEAWRAITACVAAAVLSHLYLDWQGSYGLRPFLPWSARWYYADWVAIVDPFFWLVPLVALAWGAERHWVPALVFLLGFVGVTTLVFWLGGELVVWWVRVGMVAGVVVALIGWTRHWFGVAGRRRAAVYGLLLLAGYAGAQGGASLVAKRRARAAALARFGPAASGVALTVAGRPFTWDRLAVSPESVAGAGWAIARHLDAPAVRRALATPDGRALAAFARVLSAALDTSGPERRVWLWDARFHAAQSGARGWAAVAVPVR